MGLLTELVKKEYGDSIDDQVNPEISSVGTTAIAFLRQDDDRVAFEFINLSSVAMFIGPFINPSSSRGVRLGPNGGNAGASWKEDPGIVGKEWFVVADAAASNLLVIAHRRR